MKCTLIINPRSKNGKSKKHFDTIISSCREEKMDIEHVFASTYETIKEQSLLANAKKSDIIVAVGGDGTINAVLNGFYDEFGRRISHSKFGVIYTGTSPDFCKSYNISLDHEEAIRCLSKGFVRKMVPGKIRMVTKNGTTQQETRYFACCANAGIGAGVARDANHIRKYAGDFGGTFMSLLKNLVVFKSKKIFLEIDNECRCIDHTVNISIGRTPYIASGIKINDDEMLDKDIFYVLVASGLSFQNLPGLIRQIYSGDIGDSNYLQLKKGKYIMLNSDEPDVEVEFDGDPAGYLPCTIELAYEPIELITSP